MNYDRGEVEIDLLEILQVLKKRILIIILTALIFAAGSGIYSFFIADPVYQATSRLYRLCLLYTSIRSVRLSIRFI